MTDIESRAAPTVPQRRSAFERALFALGAAACLGLLAYKLFLTGRLNVNWDEFLYLSHVHALTRGEPAQLFQGAYAHLFQWLTTMTAGEIGQIVAARIGMVGLLGVTGLLIWLLGRRWLEGFPSIVPPLVWLSALPVVKHGGSFRADSMLAPLLVASLLVLVRWRNDRWRDWTAGALIGAALAVTLKTALFLPMLVAVLVLPDSIAAPDRATGSRSAAAASGKFLLACAATGASLLSLHALNLPETPTETIAAYGERVAGKMLLDGPLFAQVGHLAWYFHWQPLPWLLIALGTVAALFQRRFQAAALVLSLLPVAFYRNSLPYFYVVMMAPAAVLAGVAVQELREFLRPRSHALALAVLQGAIAAGLLYQTAAPVRHVRQDGLTRQRALVSAVHEIFPDAVTYIDRCGMIASYRKAGFFMSTWGLDQYRARGQPFMARALSEHRPAFVLVNTPSLDPDTNGRLALFAEDRVLIRDFYPVYWGPVRVAGAASRLDGRGEAVLQVPFAGTYRVTAAMPVTIDGTSYASGALVKVSEGALTLRIAAGGDAAAGEEVTLFLAAARPPPRSAWPDQPIFTPL